MADDSEDFEVAGKVAVDILADIEAVTWEHSTKINPEDHLEDAVMRLRITMAAYAITQVLLRELAPHTRKLVEEMGEKLVTRIMKVNLPPSGTQPE